MGRETPLLADALTELASLGADPFDVSELVQRATERACQVLDADGAIVLLSLDGYDLQPAGSSGQVGDVDALLEHEGVPCRMAMQTGRVVAYLEEEAHERFPDYAALASDAGIRRVLSVPLHHRDGVLGTLSMVRTSTTDFTEPEVTAAQRLADVLAASIVREQALLEARALSAQLEHALHARVVIEQAKGMVAAELRTTVDDALEHIRSFARSRHLRLVDVASDIVERTLPVAVLRS